jgi:hypothetical protein
MRKQGQIRAVMATLLALATAAMVAACGNAGGGGGGGQGGGEGEGGPTITIGSKNFTEQYILASCTRRRWRPMASPSRSASTSGASRSPTGRCRAAR